MDLLSVYRNNTCDVRSSIIPMRQTAENRFMRRSRLSHILKAILYKFLVSSAYCSIVEAFLLYLQVTNADQCPYPMARKTNPRKYISARLSGVDMQQHFAHMSFSTPSILVIHTLTFYPVRSHSPHYPKTKPLALLYGRAHSLFSSTSRGLTIFRTLLR